MGLGVANIVGGVILVEIGLIDRTGLLLHFAGLDVLLGVIFSHDVVAWGLGLEEIFGGLILVGVVSLEEVIFLREVLALLEEVIVIVHHVELVEVRLRDLLLLLLELGLVHVSNRHGEASLGVSDVILVEIEALVIISMGGGLGFFIFGVYKDLGRIF